MNISPLSKKRSFDSERQLCDLINIENPHTNEIPHIVQSCLAHLETSKQQPIGFNRIKLFTRLHEWSKQSTQLNDDYLTNQIHQTCLDILHLVKNSKTILVELCDVKLELTEIEFEMLTVSCPTFLENAKKMSKENVTQLLMLLDNEPLIINELINLDKEISVFKYPFIEHKIHAAVYPILDTGRWADILKAYFYFSKVEPINKYFFTILGLILSNTQNLFPFILKEQEYVLDSKNGNEKIVINATYSPELFHLIAGFEGLRLNCCHRIDHAINKLNELRHHSIGFRHLLLRHCLVHTDFEGALEHITIILNEDNNNEKLHWIRCDIAQNACSFGEALKELEYLLEKEPDNKDLLNSKAFCLYQLNKKNEAFEIIDELIDQKHLDALCLRSTFHLQEKEYQLALNDALAYLEKSPKDTNILLLISKIYMDLGRYAEVVRYTTEGINLGPSRENVRLRELRGNAYVFSSLNELAYQEFTILINQYPHEADFYYFRGMSNSARNIPAAIADFNQAVRLRPNEPAYIDALESIMSDEPTKISPAA